MTDYQAVRRYRSEEMKELRRRVGDRGGLSSPEDPGDPVMTASVTA